MGSSFNDGKHRFLSAVPTFEERMYNAKSAAINAPSGFEPFINRWLSPRAPVAMSGRITGAVKKMKREEGKPTK